MGVHLAVQNGVNIGGEKTHFFGNAGFQQPKGEDLGVVIEVEIVLKKKKAELLHRQAAVTDAGDKGMGKIALPDGFGGSAETFGKAHYSFSFLWKASRRSAAAASR